ncbi:MAG: hypothetical protein ACTHW2_11045 [Tissierella sp.]|uniref:hypothetical protein n=1 Tax=Tissierella sp. TaxID=41274 RepID=UPI003F9AEC08
MILVKTLNDKIVFENKRDILTYFEDHIEEKGKEYFEENNDYIEIDGDRIESLEEWKEWTSHVSTGIYNALNELEELVEEELSLFDMDNEAQIILDIQGKVSIFDEDLEDVLLEGEYTYIYWDDEVGGETREICVEFEVMEENDDYIEETIIKIRKISLL